MITLAGVNLALPNREILTDIERDISVDKMLLLFSRAWPGPGMVFLAMPTHYRRWPPWDKPKSVLNRFYWPSGASRWGCGCFLATKAQCDALHDACFDGDGSASNEVELILSYEDIHGDTIEQITVSNITVFPPIPLYRIVNGDGSTNYGLYMVLCVDPRYYWWNIPCPDFGITETAGKTWLNVIQKISDTLETTIAVSTIPSAYLAPHRALNLTNEPLAPVMDAVALNLGARFVCAYNGNLSLMRFKDALDTFNTDTDDHPTRQFLGGDLRFMDLY